MFRLKHLYQPNERSTKFLRRFFFYLPASGLPSSPSRRSNFLFLQHYPLDALSLPGRPQSSKLLYRIVFLIPHRLLFSRKLSFLSDFKFTNFLRHGKNINDSVYPEINRRAHIKLCFWDAFFVGRWNIPYNTEIFRKYCKNIPWKYCKITKIFRNPSLMLLKYCNNLAMAAQNMTYAIFSKYCQN